MEPLEPRSMLSVAASAQLTLTSTTGSMASPVYHYDITVTNTGTTKVGTFWFAWVPGEDFLPTPPLTESNPAGWGSVLTGSGDSTDGSAIQWIASSNAIAIGGMLGGFDFTSSDSPAALAGESPSHPGNPAMTSTVYSGGPFSDGGFPFAVTPAAIVTLAASTTTLTPSQSSINQGDSVTLTATVAPSSGSGTDPTGTVTFLENGTSLATAPVTNGVAALTTSNLASGSLSITAQYGGDATYSGSTSAPVTETVNPPGATTTSLMTSSASIQSGGSVTFTATVAPVTPGGTTPTGSVTFSQDGNTLGAVAVQSDGTAQLVTTTLPVGTDNIIASYSGDAHFTASQSAATTETVSPGSAVTTTALTTSAAAIQSGNAVAFTATVAPVIPGGATPTGSVTFSQNGNSLGAVAVQSNGTATLSTSSLPLGSDTVTATYGGDATYAASISAPVSETVTNPATLVPTIAKSTLATALVAGAAAHGNVTLTIANATAAAIKGKITIELFASVDGSIDGSAIQLAHVVKSLNATTTKPAKATLPVKIAASTLPAGSYTLIARVVDLSGNNGDSSAGPTVTVAAPFIALSETVAKMTIPLTAVAGAKAHAVAVLQITNSGNITTPGMTTVALFATASGVVDGSATQINSVTKALKVKVGKSMKISIPVKLIPAIAPGAYTIVAQVTDPNGTITTVMSGVVTITM